MVWHEDDMKITRESVITISGEVKKRDADTVNPKMETGDVALHAADITMQNGVARALPFEAMGAVEFTHNILYEVIEDEKCSEFVWKHGL